MKLRDWKKGRIKSIFKKDKEEDAGTTDQTMPSKVI